MKYVSQPKKNLEKNSIMNTQVFVSYFFFKSINCNNQFVSILQITPLSIIFHLNRCLHIQHVKVVL
jgi:hypothetical protein